MIKKGRYLLLGKITTINKNSQKAGKINPTDKLSLRLTDYPLK